MVQRDDRFSTEWKGLVQDVTSLFIGLIFLAMGVQFDLAGFKKFFPQS